MKNFIKLYGIIALTAVIGFSMAGCKNDDDDGSGGGGVDWVGKWVNVADSTDYLILNADKTWTNGTTTGKKWDYKEEDLLIPAPVLSLVHDDGTDRLAIKVIDSKTVEATVVGLGTKITYKKQ
jgi:hypothetical protein